MIALLGIPYDESSSYLRGAALGPAAIRKALHSPSSNFSTERGLDLAVDTQWVDRGDVTPNEASNWREAIETTVGNLLDQSEQVISLGGDHSVTYPILKAYGHHYDDLTILHLDAHGDLYDEFEGDRYSHACPFARIMEAGLAKRLVQVGIRTMTPHQRSQAERFGVEVFEMRAWQQYKQLQLEGPLYLSVDLDVLDPAFAPGVSHHEPGGLSTRDVIQIIQGIQAPVVGADIVELNPVRDFQEMTAMAAAKILKEIVCKMLSTT